ncbi:hypothetical protein N658DRAFT_394542, partial [Parathielavia hyrcaniae]
SLVASSPACFLAISASVIGRFRYILSSTNVCHGLDTLANPDSNAINEIPITPILSKHALDNP